MPVLYEKYRWHYNIIKGTWDSRECQEHLKKVTIGEDAGLFNEDAMGELIRLYNEHPDYQPKESWSYAGGGRIR